ncbi:Hint domain-containing protein [Mesobacterium pallidum]|uniref:Hint domain-containing protein n=1 Tax=Mesobacterium pallidum TaxID=2872037 RepID=UPI001EE28B7E|nr:Hint domain-containing protein [Mesobacterium pallidum]
MVQFTFSRYTVSPRRAGLPTDVGASGIYMGPAAPEGVMVLEEPRFPYDDDRPAADCAWILRDDRAGCTLRAAQFTVQQGGQWYRVLLSDAPLLGGAAYTCLHRDLRPGLRLAAPLAPAYAGLPSLAEDCQVETEQGFRPVGALRPGMRLVTRDGPPEPLRWIGRADMSGTGGQAPMRLATAAPGARQRMHLGPAHGVLVGGPAPRILFDEPEVLLPARFLPAPVARQVPTRRVAYHQLMFDRHVLVNCGGIWVESFYPGGASLAALGQAARTQIAHVFPALANGERPYGDVVRHTLTEEDARLLVEMDTGGPTPVKAGPQGPLRQAA